MRQVLLGLLFLCLVLSGTVQAGKRDSTRFAFSLGTSFGTSNVKRDFTNIPHPGLDMRMAFYFTPNFRISAEYTKMFEHKIRPYWVGVKSDVYEVNLQYMASVTGYTSKFYIIGGYAIQDWQGVFVGEGFENETGQYGSSDKSYTTRFPKLSLGFGLQRSFNKFDIYGEFRYRFNHREPKIPLNIIDVSYAFGLRYRLHSLGLKRAVRTLMPADRYHWF